MIEGDTTRRLSRRRAVALATGSAGAAALGFVSGQNAASAGAAASEGASGPAGSTQGGTGLVVSGSGRAAGDVTGGVLQFLIRFGPDAPQVATGSAGGGYYGSGGPAPDEDALSAVINALVENGIDRERIVVLIGSSVMYGMFGSGVSVVGALVDEPALATLEETVTAVTEAAKATNLQFDQIGAIYIAADCEAVSDEALAAAVADARAQAEALAAALGIELGEMIGASATPPYSPYSGYDGSGSGCAGVFDLEDAIRFYFPPYIPGVEPEFAMTASVTLTFAIDEETAG